MKRNIIKYLAFTLLAASCSTDIDQLVLQGFDNVEPRELTAQGATTIVLDKNNEEGTALTLQWGEYSLSVSDDSYGVPDESIDCFVELSPTQDFAVVDTALLAKDDNVSFTQKKSFTNDELNRILSKKGYTRDAAADIYTRIRFDLGANKAPGYSNVLKLNITPYGIIFDRMELYSRDDITDAGKRKSLGMMLYSPDETGIYQGYISGTDWMNFFAMERDQTIWGTVPGSAFSIIKLTDDVEVGNTIYNFWLPSQAGCYRVTVDVNEQTWTSEEISSMKVVSSSGKQKPMTFDKNTNSWSGVIATKTAGETISFKASAWKKTADNEEGESTEITHDNLLTIGEVGTWLVTIDLNGATPTARYEATDQGEEADPEPDPEPEYASILMVPTSDWNTTLCRLFSPDNNGQYTGYYITTSGWENTLFKSEDGATIYGSKPNEQFTLYTADDRWSLWVDEQVGLYVYTADLNAMTWGYKYISKLTVAGSIAEGEVDMTYDQTTRTYYADVTVNNPAGWGVKIKVNDSWDDVLVKKADGMLGYKDGGDITLPAAGHYRMTIKLFDLARPASYEFIAK